MEGPDEDEDFRCFLVNLLGQGDLFLPLNEVLLIDAYPIRPKNDLSMTTTQAAQGIMEVFRGSKVTPFCIGLNG